MKRRKFIKITSLASLSLLIGCGNNGDSGNNKTSTDSNGNSILRTDSKLPIPTLLKPTNIGGVENYNLTIKSGTHSFISGTQTNILAINNNYLGPTLLIKNEDKISINYKNELTENITMHGHGMHAPAKMDGTTHQIISPNQLWESKYRVKQTASTNWYHSHIMDKTGEQVYKGLAGLIIVEDTNSNSLDLPKTYGVDDIPLVLQDRYFSNGQLDYSPIHQQIMHGYNGDVYITNGAIDPNIDLEKKEIRFRILNGSNSSVYDLGFSDNRSFKQITTDGSFLESPVAITRLKLSPAERAEIILDLSQDEVKEKAISFKDFNRNKNFLEISIKEKTIATTTTPTTLIALEKLQVSNSVKTRTFTLSKEMGRNGKFTINGKSMNMMRIDEVVKLGDVEVWEIINNMPMDHNFHIHATHFMIIERNGSSSSVKNNEKGYKDVVYLAENERVKIILKMKDYVDPNTPYMYHCHFLEHEDHGMMGQFTVVS